MCAGLVLSPVNLRAICCLCFSYGEQVLRDFAIDAFFVFVESDMNEIFVREPNVHETLWTEL